MTGETKVCELKDGTVLTRQIEPEEFGLIRTSPNSLQGGDPLINAKQMKKVLSASDSPLKDWVLANTSAALVVAEKAKDFRGGVAMAAEAINSGLAREKLDSLVVFTQRYST